MGHGVGDIALIGDLKGVVAAIQLSRSTMQNVKQNLFWALIYNTIGIPWLGFLSPCLAETMALARFPWSAMPCGCGWKHKEGDI